MIEVFGVVNGTAEHAIDIGFTHESFCTLIEKSECQLSSMEITSVEPQALIEEGKCFSKTGIGLPTRSDSLADSFNGVSRKTDNLGFAVNVYRRLSTRIIDRPALR